MATGDVPNIVGRMVAVLPPWFPTPIANSPILQGVLTGIATPLSFAYNLYVYARAQTRIKTAFGPFLDLIAFDYFGPTFTRRTSEPDASFQSRILTFLLLARNTVAGITAMLTDLTGIAPALLEPAIGTGGYDAVSAFAFDSVGCWSGTTLQITAFRPPGQGIPNVDGFDGGFGGFDVGAIEWSDISQVTGAVTDAEITLRVRQWVAAGVNYTLNITNVPQAAPPWVTRANGVLPQIDINFAANAAWVQGVGVMPIPSLLTVVRSTNETVTDANGNITYALPNTPAYASAGLQSWEARTNLLTQSQAIGSWTPLNATLANNVSIAPDGTKTAASITATSTSPALCESLNSFSAAAGVPYTFSVYVSSASGPWVSLEFTDNVANGAGCYFNPFTGAVGASVGFGTGTFISSSVQQVSQGFFRFSITASVSSANAAMLVAINCLNGNGSGVSTVGQSLKLWGAQVEQEAAASPYIPTTTAAVTRSADAIFLTNPLNFGTSFTALVSGTSQQLTSVGSGGFPGILTISDDTINNRMVLFTDSGAVRGIFLAKGGTAEVNANAGGSIVVGTPTTWAFSVSPAGFASAFDGNSGTTGGALSIPTGLNTILIGQNGGPLDMTGEWLGNISRITIWPTTFLSAATLASIT